MPYLLTSNPPGSPTSWVKMETESVLSGHSEFSSGQQQQQPNRSRPRALPPPLSAGTGTLNAGSKYANYVNTTLANSGHSSIPNLTNGGKWNTSSGYANHHGTVPNFSSPYLTGSGGGVANGTPPVMSPTSVISNYSMAGRNTLGNQLTVAMDPRTNSVLSNPSYSQVDSPYQTAVTLPHGEALRVGFGQRQQEKIEVQVLPQDPDWADNATAVTGLSASDPKFNYSDPSLHLDPSSLNSTGGDVTGWKFTLQRHIGPWTVAVIAVAAFLSPALMVILPRLDFIHLRDSQLRCDVECDGLLISLCIKLILLLLGTWAIFFRHPKATMPRIYLYRAFVALLLFVFTFTFWLFFAVRISSDHQRRRLQYFDIVQFAVSMVDALLFVHFVAVLLIEIRHLSPAYHIKVVRSPDGQSQSFAIGSLTVQRAATWVLEKYYSEFPIFNPYLERLPTSSGINNFSKSNMKKNGNAIGAGSFKYFDGDGMERDTRLGSPLTRGAFHRDSSHSLGNYAPVNPNGNGSNGHNDRFYEEYEYERRLKKRRARLVTATEEAFAQVKKINEANSKTPTNPMDPNETAQTIFPGIARALQKYLRITRQQPRHTMDSILKHLSTCLKYDMSAKAFLEKFICTSPVLQDDRESIRSVQTWSLICDSLLTRQIKPGMVFQLRQGDVSLLCHVQALPHFNITEEIIDAATNKFLLRNNSETPV